MHSCMCVCVCVHVLCMHEHVFEHKTKTSNSTSSGWKGQVKAEVSKGYSLCTQVDLLGVKEYLCLHNSQYSLRLYLSHCTKLHTHTATTEHLNSHVMSIQLQNISTPMLCLYNYRTSQLPCYVMQPQNISTPMLCHATTEQLNSHVMSMQLQNISTLMSMSLQLQNISALTLCLCNRRTSQLPCCVYGTTKQLNSHVMSM